MVLSFKSVLFFKYKFFILDHIMMTSRKALLTKGFSLGRNIFFIIGAW